jgi:lipoate-protein ligase A
VSPHSYLVVNSVPPFTPPSIVLGISGRPERWLHIPRVRAASIETIQRFTGGGTVYCDPSTFFVSFILARASVPTLAPYPSPLLHFIASLYSPIFPSSLSFSLQSNDFCLHTRKVAGNAQAITRTHLLHHSSFLWKVDEEAMGAYLAMPPKERQPGYREGRGHGEFVGGLAEWMKGVSGVEEGVEWMKEGLVREMEGRGWTVKEVGMDAVEGYLDTRHDRVTKVIDWDEEMERINREAQLQLNTNS